MSFAPTDGRPLSVQSLIVEGGRQTHESFIEAGLWDEIRVETNHRLTVTDGTHAPLLPSLGRLRSHHIYDGNSLDIYTR